MLLLLLLLSVPCLPCGHGPPPVAGGQEVLLDDHILKLGVNIGGDVIKLATDYGVQVMDDSSLHHGINEYMRPSHTEQCLTGAHWPSVVLSLGL